MQQELEDADFQLAQFTLKRNQSKGLYESLMTQQQRVVKVLNQSAKVAIVSVEAVAPDKKSSPKVVMNTAVAGMFGLLMSLLGVLAIDWYRKESRNLEK